MLTSCVSILDSTSQGEIQPDPSKRSFGAMIDDRQLKAIVAVNIKKASSELAQSNINVDSFNSVILLTGQVPTKALRELAGATARKIFRVRLVNNELEIGKNTNFGQTSYDFWLKSKIASKLAINKDIQSNRVEVIVENSVVFLMGMLTKVQTEKITDVLRNTKGVTKVVRAIEYIDD